MVIISFHRIKHKVYIKEILSRIDVLISQSSFNSVSMVIQTEIELISYKEDALLLLKWTISV